MIEHVERVAASVAPEARTLAYLHDVLEWSATSLDELVSHGLTPSELRVLQLLTREPGETYELHALRIAYAGAHEGALARHIKLADLDDHLLDRHALDAPPHAWARHRILASSAMA